MPKNARTGKLSNRKEGKAVETKQVNKESHSPGETEESALLECAGLRFSRAGKDFFREREKAVSGTEWDDLHKAGWAKSHDGRSLGRGSRGGRPLLLPTHT